MSSIFEDYQWTIYSITGLALLVLGNVINQWKKQVLAGRRKFASTVA
jgi:hypothetical protein